MCEDIFSDESLEFMFQSMSKEDIKEFFAEMERAHSLWELMKKGYSFSGGSFSKSVFFYKDNPPFKIIVK